MQRSQLTTVFFLLASISLGPGCQPDEGKKSDDSDVTTTTDSGAETSASSGESSTGDTGQSGEIDCEQSGPDVSSGILRRLSRVEYQLTLQDLFHLDEPPPIDAVPQDILQEGFTSFAQLQSMSAQHLRAYWDTASALFDQLAAEPARMTAVVGCQASAATCTRSFASSFGRLAYRRDLTPEELDDLVSDAESNAQDATDQLRYVTESLLISPHFLYRVEVGDPVADNGTTPAGDVSTLSALELASKLSFTLWGRSPSAAILDRAEAGELDTDEGLMALAIEMLGDDKARYYYGQFFRQWLGYATLRAPTQPTAAWSDALLPLMQEETDALVFAYAWEPGRSIFDALTANSTTVAPQLASFYGLSADASGQVEFSAGDARYNAGLLGHASIMSQKTDGDEVAVRGNWLRRTFLCEELHIPENLAEVIGEQLVGLTSMEIIAERNEQPSCKKCHSAIDPIGVGLAQFDAAGLFDETVDLSTYPVAPGFPDADDPQFTNLAQLAEKLRALPKTAECLTERVFIYTEGRHPQDQDRCTTRAATDAFIQSDGSFFTLLSNIVGSPRFRLRRVPTVQE